MILTVTINPLLERRYYYSSIDLNSVNRNGRQIIKAGGKGINISRQLNRLGIKNNAMIFSGGSNGKLLKESLRSEKIIHTDVLTRNETRDAAIIIDQSDLKIYSFFGENTLISSGEVQEFILKLERAIQTCETVIFSGSSPCKETDSVFVEGINIANKMDKISICDTYGRHLIDCLNSAPTIIHNNKDEIQNSLNIKLDFESDYVNFLNSLYDKGIKQAYITDSSNALYASNFDFHYRIIPPEIRVVDSTGSGDAFVAGIVYGWHNKLTFSQQLKFATALGALNAKSLEVCEIDLADANQLAEKIQLEEIGKKLNQIDDSVH